MLDVLTAERIRLCGVARRRAYSISALAAELKRDPKSVVAMCSSWKLQAFFVCMRRSIRVMGGCASFGPLRNASS
jgi:hypothetical protein